MPLKPNLPALHRALGAAHAGHIDRGTWSAPNQGDRKPEDCAAMDDKDCAYPLFKSGKLSAGAVAAALGRARTNAPPLVPHLEAIDAALKADDDGDEEKDMSRAAGGGVDLSRAPRLSKCPSCGSHDIERVKGAPGEGPTDKCEHCGKKFPHSPGTITAAQVSAGKSDADDHSGPPNLASRFGKSVMSA